MKTESDTPRTDAETMRDEYDHVDTEFGAFAPSNTVSADFARQLERDLNDVTTERNNLDASLTAAISSSNARHFESMEYEAKSKQLEIKLNEVIKQRDDLMTMLEKIAGIAEQVDSWESFPSDPIEQAYDLMQSIKQTNKIK